MAGSLEAIEQLDGRSLAVRLAPLAGPQFDQGVRLFRAGTQDAARPVILERSSDQPHPVRQQCGGQRIAGMAYQALAIEPEAQRPGSIDGTAGSSPERLGHRRANSTSPIAWVRVSRVTFSQARQAA